MNIELFHVYNDGTLDDYRTMATKIKSGVFLLDKAYARGTNLVFDTNASSETDAVVYVVANGIAGANNNTDFDYTIVQQMAGRSNRRKGKCIAEVFFSHVLASTVSDGGLTFLKTREKVLEADDSAFIFRYAVENFNNAKFP